MFPWIAWADMGPKPSVIIDIQGVDGVPYYGTLLSSVESTGPYSVLDPEDRYSHYQEGDEEYEVFKKFVDYRDKDGYYFLQYFEECTRTHQLSWTYYPPREFKLLLYFPEEDRFLESDTTYERYAFGSYFTASVSPAGVFLEKSYDYTGEVGSLIARIVLTIIAEMAIALLFGFRLRRQLRFILVVNVITQIALNLALNIINYQSGALAFFVFYVLLEIGVVVVEGVLYTRYLRTYSEKEIPTWKPSLYALVANAASFALGIGLAIWIPGIL